MKNFRKQNYYELLEVSPVASLEEITRAYQSAMEAFNPDSVAVYSLFDNDEDREGLLDKIQEAYRTLARSRTRREYDRHLLAQGMTQSQAGPDLPAYAEEDEPGPKLVQRTAPKLSPLSPLVRAEGEPLNVKPGQILNGADLKNLRQSRQVDLEELAHRIRVHADILEDLESDEHQRLPARVYVKGFLKAYAQALMLDPNLVSEAYLAGMKKEE
ncbi:MAG: helix-turn-helix domain-containing protein [Deltaproteobacteria bacterium]|nr:helix-turn-helix domain-containing protein [Deltaproteobacteria bacterium]